MGNALAAQRIDSREFQFLLTQNFIMNLIRSSVLVCVRTEEKDVCRVFKSLFCTVFSLHYSRTS